MTEEASSLFDDVAVPESGSCGLRQRIGGRAEVDATGEKLENSFPRSKKKNNNNNKNQAISVPRLTPPRGNRLEKRHARSVTEAVEL